MDPVFGGYREIKGFGWLPRISYDEYVKDPEWEYETIDIHKMVIIARHSTDGSFAWVELKEEW